MANSDVPLLKLDNSVVADSSDETDQQKMAKYDLTSKMAPYLDVHLILPLLEFMEQTNLYYSKDILKAKLNLLQKTSMVDLSREIHNVIHPEEADESHPSQKKFAAKRTEVVSNLERLQNECEPIVALLTSEEVQAQVQQSEGDGTQLRSYLETTHNFEASHLDTLYSYSQLLYDIGNYQSAEIILYQYFILSNDAERTYAALWGKFASAILGTSWESAFDEMQKNQRLYRQ